MKAPITQAPITDLHCDTALELAGGADLIAGNPEGHVDVARLERGGVTVQVFVGFVSSMIPEERAFAEAMGLLDAIDVACARSGGALVRVERPPEADQALAAGATTAVVAAIENGHAIAGDLTNLERLRRRGVRYMTLTHARHLAWAASSGQELGQVSGLTELGKEAVAAMNELGIIVDVSHVHESTFWDVARCSRKPFIASHSNAAALCPCARNLTDEQLRAIADHGGVVGVNFYPGFLSPTYERQQEALLGDLFATLQASELRHLDDPAARLADWHRIGREQRERMRAERPSLETVVAHIEHMVSVAGEDVVALGSDFDGIPDVPAGLEDCAAFPRLIEALAARGMREGTIAKIANGNFRRVWAEAG